jgi:hypothetical protein
MEPAPPSTPDDSRDHVTPEPGVTLRDADEMLERAAADEMAANAARERLLLQPMADLDPDPQIAPLLAEDERVLAVRHAAMLDRRMPASSAPPGLAGDFYVTSRRAILVGHVTVALALEDIEDVILSGERLLLAMRDGGGLRLDVAHPRVLRVEIAAARALARQAAEAAEMSAA